MKQHPEAEMYESVYRGEFTDFGPGAPVRWSIGEPQPDIAALISAGKVRGEVLDAGCGEAAVCMQLAAMGHTTVGLDISPTAIALAKAEAAERGLANATFEVADVTSFSGYDGRFDTVIDGQLLHSLPIGLRDAYQECIFRAAAPSASYFVLAFDKDGVPEGLGGGHTLHPVNADELRDLVAKYWTVDQVTPARVHANIASGFSVPGLVMRDEPNGRKSMNAWLLSAHRD